MLYKKNNSGYSNPRNTSSIDANVFALITQYLPTQTGNSGKVLGTNGFALSWITPPTGISSLNALIASTQVFSSGTLGTDFNIVSSLATHTFNLPVASATNTGKLSSTDWSTFDGKQNALGFTPENVANKSDSFTASSSTTYATTKALVDGLDTKQDKILISSATASNSAVIDFTLPTGYDYFELFINYLIPQTASTSLFLRASINGGATFLAGGTDYQVHRSILTGSSGITYVPSFGSASEIAPIGALLGNASGRFFRASFRIFDPSNSTQNKNITGEFAMSRVDAQPALGSLSARVLNTSPVNAIRLLMNSGNIASGNFKLYGYKS